MSRITGRTEESLLEIDNKFSMLCPMSDLRTGPMSGRQERTESIRAIIIRLEEQLLLCDELRLSLAAIDLNQAIEKLRAEIAAD